MANQLKESPIVPDKPLTAEEEIESVASMRLAYQDLSLKKNQEEARLKNIDPIKAKQMERLGMGFNLKGWVIVYWIEYNFIENWITFQEQLKLNLPS